MFENIGGKIKNLANVMCWIGVFISLIEAFIMFASMDADVFRDDRTVKLIAGIIWMIVGPIMSWISSSLIYGFGELIENSSDISYYVRKIANNDNKKPSKDEQLKILLNTGLITQEEYDAKIK